MSNPCATVNKILPFSCVDGPGNRLAIFLQGCNFRCLNCHNPYTINLCNHCGDCVATCPHGALSLLNHSDLTNKKVIWDAARCQQCDTCLTTCGRNSTPMATPYSIEQMLSVVRKYAPFLTGITTSGGESTLQLNFIRTLFEAIKSQTDIKQLTCFVDSNGYLPETGWQRILPAMDGAMIDLKAWDNHVHQQLTGRDNIRVINSIKLLAKANKLYEVRLLVIPEQCDYLQHIDKLAPFLYSLSPDLRIRLNAFQHHGVHKGEAKQWRTAQKQDIEQLANALERYGLTNLLKPALYLPS